MAATSLAEQLKQLRTPQTALLLQEKKRASLLFDPKEAANLDRETVLSIGQSGLQQLIELSSVFEEFRDTLFAQSSLHLERSIHDSATNKLLNNRIEKFLVYLSPYFLLKSCHKALEWLIHRFHIHRYNKDQFLMLILPYHETRMFVRALQILDLSDQSGKWHWLEPLQKPGVPLSTITLINRITRDDGFLKLISEHVATATKIYGDKATCLSTLYAFYTMAILGTVHQCSNITEVQLNHLLPTLMKGLKCSVPDFAASTYMILAKIVTKERLNSQVMNYFLERMFRNPALHDEATILLIYLYENPFNRVDTVTEELVHQLSQHSWLIDSLIKVKSSHGLEISRFITRFLNTAIQMIVTRSTRDTIRIQEIIEQVFTRLPLKDCEVDSILRNAFKGKDLTLADLTPESKQILSNLFSSLERRYSEPFDRYLKELMKGSESDRESRSALEFLMSWHDTAKKAEKCLNILDRLNHYNYAKRVSALQVVAKDEVEVSEGLQDSLYESLLARFRDDDVRVVETLLSFSISRLKSLFPTKTLIEELLVLLSKCHTRNRSMLAVSALKILLEVCEEGDDTRIFIAALPYLFPSDSESVGIALKVLTSDFARKNPYMIKVLKEITDTSDPTSITYSAFHNILQFELLPPTARILRAMKQQMLHGDAASMFFNMILLGSVCRVPVGSLSPVVAKDVIEMAAQMITKYPKLDLMPGCNHLSGDNIQLALSMTSRGVLPVQVGTYVLEMVHRRLDLRTNFGIDFEGDYHRSVLILRLLEIFFQGIGDPRFSEHYETCLNIFLKIHFPSMQDLLKFLSQFFASPVQPRTAFSCLEISLMILRNVKKLQWVFEDDVFVANLLLALGRVNLGCREVAVAILTLISQTFNLKMRGFSTLVRELAERGDEIRVDPQQVSLQLYVLLSPDPDVRDQLPVELREGLAVAEKLLFEMMSKPEIAMHTKAQLLELTVHVNGPTILRKLAPFALELLEELRNEDRDQRRHRYKERALKCILQRFNASTCSALTDPIVWKLFEGAITEHSMEIERSLSKSTSPSIVLLKEIDENFFESLGKVSSKLQGDVLSKLIDIVTDCDKGTVITAAGRAFRRLKIHASFIVKELRTVLDVKPERNLPQGSLERRRRSRPVRTEEFNPQIINSKEWKRGITILEFIQKADNIQSEKLLFPVLFEFLRLCLRFEEDNSIEYTNQLLLSTTHHLLLKNPNLPDAHLHVDLTAQCIRVSRNPQTHHHALLVLVELFKSASVDSALHNVMPIFTFVGSTVLRQDDAYSIQIISKTIETIIPVVNAGSSEKQVCEILRIFVSSLPDVPEHRRQALFLKLLTLMQDHLHLYYLLTFESHVISHQNELKKSSDKLDFSLAISKEFPPRRMLEVCVKLLQFLAMLPREIDEDSHARRPIPFEKKYIFDVNSCSALQLRHFKYRILQFLSAFLSSEDFIGKVAMLDDRETADLKDLYHRLIVEIVLAIQSATRNADLHQGKHLWKYWKVLLHYLYDILDLVNNLLPNEMFLATVEELLAHRMLSVRKKAFELLNARLQLKKFQGEDYERLLRFIDLCLEVIRSEGKSNQEVEVLQQISLVTLKLVAKLLAGEYPEKFQPVFEVTTEFLREKEGPVLASAVLCVAELCGSLKIHALQSLNKFFPAVLQLLRKCQEEVPDTLTISIVSALQKIVESIGNFLSFYLEELLLQLSRLNSLYTDSEDQKVGLVVSRLKTITQKLSTCIPLRVMLPAVKKTYESLLETKSYRRIPPLLRIFSESFGNMEPSELNSSITNLIAFFLKVLQFREDVQFEEKRKDEMEVDDESENRKLQEDIAMVEEAASKSLVSLVLKLSEISFRPLYYKLYDWASSDADKKLRNITFFRLSANIAECLKSLFVLFAGHFVKHAATLLRSNNSALLETPENLTLPLESQRVDLVEAILLTLLRIFTYDVQNFVSQERFETLAQPIVDQIENISGDGSDNDEKRAKEFVIPCIAAFAGDIQDDSLHKQLVYQVLLKTRHGKAAVRQTALNSLVEIARKLGEDFLSLLPETIPFLAELLEDEDEATEKSAQNAVRTLEEILGEPLQKYF